MGDMQTQIDYPKGIGFEQVWATLDRVAKRQEETALSLKDTEQVVKEIGKRLGDFTNSFGDVVEHLIPLPRQIFAMYTTNHEAQALHIFSALHHEYPVCPCRQYKN